VKILAAFLLALVSVSCSSGSSGSMAEVARQMRASDPKVRETLFAELQPIALTNCELERFGETNDGGYLMCANLLQDAQAAYSYGISGYDKWGCDIATKLHVRLHQYDCFDTRQPKCAGETIFHAECVGATRKTEEGRIFDTMAAHFTKNGDTGKRLALKMDVEGAEWDSLLNASDETLQQIDQLAIEFHLVHDPKFVDVVKRLKQHFHVAHLHFNNWSCAEGIAPFPAWAYEVLFVSKRIGVPDPSGRRQELHASAAPNAATRPDCQVVSQ
jgi:hypothetical protein